MEELVRLALLGAPLPLDEREGVAVADALEAEGTGRLLPPRIAVPVARAAVVAALGSTALDMSDVAEELDVVAAAEAVADATALLVGATV